MLAGRVFGPDGECDPIRRRGVDPVAEAERHLAIGLTAEIDGASPDDGVLLFATGEAEATAALLGQIVHHRHGDQTTRAGDGGLCTDARLPASVLQGDRPGLHDPPVDQIVGDTGDTCRNPALFRDRTDRTGAGVAEPIAVGEQGIIAGVAAVERGSGRVPGPGEAETPAEIVPRTAVRTADKNVGDAPSLSPRKPGGYEGIGCIDLRADPQGSAGKKDGDRRNTPRLQSLQHGQWLFRLKINVAQVALELGIGRLSEHDDRHVRTGFIVAVRAQCRGPALGPNSRFDAAPD